ncbi:MAG: bifunctional serine/threonine-protein kinase/formylglycine-generating enzyme family protein [Myxococcota bacterium]
MSIKLEFSRGEVIADKYEVVDLLDESPLGITYRTKHIKTGKYVRLLVLRPKVAGREQKDQIVEAFKRSKAIVHPHLVKVGELGEHDGVAYLTYEDFEGGTLRELLQEYRVNGKQFALKEAAQICMQILEGLDALHKGAPHAEGAPDSGSIVMRALRPEYVLVSVRYTGPRKQTFVAQTKVIGGGFWDLVPAAVLAEDEFTRGEAQYIAPELKSFEPHFSPRSDVFSAGVIFYEMLVGQAPVGSYQLPKVKRPDLPDHVNTVIELALAQAPDDRYPSAGDFVSDLQRTFQEGAFGDEPVRRPLVTPIGWALALTLVVFIGVIVFALRPNPERDAKVADAAIREQVYLELQESQPSPDEFKKVYERHPPNMIYIPAGPFVVGRMRTDLNAVSSEPIAQRKETKGYLIDVFEYPNLKNTAPKFDVTYKDAERLCQEAGKRLCTADEWERACKGPRSLNYSYGDTYDDEFCGKGLEEWYPSGTKENCKSEWGVYDLSGDFREWTGSSSKPGRTIVKGGLQGSPDKGSRCAHAEDESENYTDKSLSFRCCRDVDAPPVVATPAPPPN